MGVDSTASEYNKFVDAWLDMRNTREGERAVKEAGTRYLPMLGGQANDNDGKRRYAAYKTRASYYNATGRTVDGLSGMVFRKDPIIEFPDGMSDFIEDVTLNGLHFNSFSEQLVEEVLVTGRAGVLVDMPRATNQVRTQADAARQNIRPFWAVYKTENITNWSVQNINNRPTLTQVRLFELANEPGGDEFEFVEVEQYRVLDLAVNESAGSLYYRQRLFRRDPQDKKKWVQYGDDIVPTMNSQPLSFIPFVFFGTRDTSPRVDRPPMLDLAEVNLSHYRTSADLEHGAHFTALPTPYVFGISNDDAPTEIGPEVVWHSEDENVTAGMLEFSGSGLASLEKRLERKEGQMAALGARMLAPEKRQVEAAETATIHRAGEISILASLAKAVSSGLNTLLELSMDWLSLTGGVSAELNTDYLPQPMTPQELTSLMQAVQGGDISKRTFFENLQRGEIIRADKSFEEEQEEIDEDPPASSFGGFGSGFGGGG